MAEAIGAFYATETVIEGVVAGALAVSGSTVPLHAHFQKIKPSSAGSAKGGSTANIIKNKIYAIGGEAVDFQGGHGIHVLSLSPDFGFSRTKANQAVEVDHEFQQPELRTEQRPLQPHTTHLEKKATATKDRLHHASWARTQHSSVIVDDKVYILGGLATATSAQRKPYTGNVIPLDVVIAYDTLTSTYAVLFADLTRCTEGVPEPRYSASSTSSPFPSSVSAPEGEGPSLASHGTIFLHGGYNVSGQPLNDTWTFDIGTRAWHRFPTVVEEALPDEASFGQIAYIEHHLWYINTSTVMYLELSEHAPESADDALSNPSLLSTGRVGSGQWQVVYPPPEADPASLVQRPESKLEAETPSIKAVTGHIPTESTHHVVPVTTGAGRTYLLTLSSKYPETIHLFQIPSSPKTTASIKDVLRDKASTAIASLPDSWKSGKHEWSEVEVIQSSMQEGELDRPSRDLENFATAAWAEYGDKFVIWGGQLGNGRASGEGWIVHLD